MARKFKTPITLDELGSASSQAIAANVDGDTQNRINIDAGGKVTWGSGSATGDTTLYRSAADTLKTDDAFTATSLAVTGQFTFPTSDGSADQVITTNGSGTLTWSDVSANATVSDTAPSSPATGQIWYESDTGKTFVYYDSYWIEVGASPPASPFITDLDEDTKIQVEESADEDKIRFDTAGSERMIIDASGNVGIGTTTPGQALDVRGRIVANYTDNAFPLSVQSGQSTSGIILADAGTTSNVVLRSNGDDFQIRTNASDRVTVDSSGNVGIGTTTPRTPLEIKGASSGSVDEVLLLAADGNQVAGSGARLHLSGGNATQRSAYVEGVNTGGATNAHALTFGTSTDSSSPVERMRIDSSGNVGIGTTSPSQTLHVNSGTGNVPALFESTDSVSIIQIKDNATTTPPAVAAVGDELRLQTSGSSRVTVDSSGNVGIGTTTPAEELDVVGDVQVSGRLGIGGGISAELDIKGASNPEIRLQSTDSSDPFLYFGDQVDAVRGGIGMDTSANALQLRGYNNATRMTIASSGNVGIGETSPAVDLHVQKVAAAAFTLNTAYDTLILENGTSGKGPVLQLHGPTNGLAEIGFSDTTRNVGQINYNFSTNEMNFKVNGATRLWINASGVVHPEGNGTQDLGASSRRWRDIYATNTSIQTSDVRDKTNIADVDYGLEFINGLRPVTYTWDDRNGYTGTRTHMGFVAQEVAELMGDEATNRAVWVNSPSVDYTDSETGEVATEPDSQGLRYAELMAPMVKAIQELTARIEALEAN